MSELTYANGMNKFAAAKIGKFTFGDYFREIEVDEDERMFVFVLNEYVTTGGNKRYFVDEYSKEWRDYFKEFWGNVPGFILKVVEFSVKELD